MKNYKYLVAGLLLLLILLLIVKNKQLKNNSMNVNEGFSYQQEQMGNGLPEVQTIVVTAENNTFTPATFNTQLRPVILQITAIDKNYKFTQKESGLDVEIPMGETVEVRVDFTEEGEYKYTCGVGCSGEIISVMPSGSDVQEDPGIIPSDF